MFNFFYRPKDHSFYIMEIVRMHIKRIFIHISICDLYAAQLYYYDYTHRMQETKRLLSVKQTMFHLILGVQKKPSKIWAVSAHAENRNKKKNEHDLYWLTSSRNVVFDNWERLKALERADLRRKKPNAFKKVESTEIKTFS